MANLLQIRNRISLIVQDTSFSSEVIDSYINEGIQTIAAEVLLPDLEKTGEVTFLAGESKIDIPADWNFGRNLYAAASKATKRPVKVYTSSALLARDFPEFLTKEGSGNIIAVTKKGERLVCFPTPASNETLVCSFYEKPSLLVENEDVPSVIPEYLQFRLLVAFVCTELYDLVEDGVEGVKANFQTHSARFAGALEILDEHFTAGRSRVKPNRTSDWE